MTTPIQSTPLTSCDERMHVMNEDCWCGPLILASGQGEDFTVEEVNHRGQLQVGDRVAVDDAGLAELRRIMRDATGEEPPPNNEGVIEQVWARDGNVTCLIEFDNGGGAPYPASEIRRIV